MELILINDDKLKIMLSREDMQKYNIDGDADYSKLSTRCAIKDLLSEAKQMVGFSTDGESYLVQLFTSRTGGCEIFVTKGEGEVQPAIAVPEPQRRTYMSVYSFDSLAPLLAVCRRLSNMPQSPEGRVYRDIYGIYYLCLAHTDLSPYTRLSPFTFILEYGKRESSEKFDGYISEYGSFVCNNAVEVFGKM